MILLDNGHGINTPGKRSPVWSDGSQLFEWEFTRDIVKRISRQLDALHIKNAVIVPEALDVTLKARIGRANRLAEDNPGSFFISIHGNAAPRPNTASGWEVWTSPGKTESDKIAAIILENAKKNLPDFKMRSDCTDGDPDKESKFYVLVKTICPAILTENLFYDNERDCRFMMSEEGRAIIAKLHVEALTQYLKL